MEVMFRCSKCQQPYPMEGVPHRCQCGGVFDVDSFPTFDSTKVTDLPRMWKYSQMFGLPAYSPIVTLGEGDTPLVEGRFNHHSVFFKMESLNPTGSYKDRGSAVLTSFLLSRGVAEAVEDSSGNAGASFAAYAARAGINAHIYVPESTSGQKADQISMYGADVVRIPGPRSEAARAVLEAVEQGSVYASHAYMPFGLTGIATISYEIVEALGISPGTIIAPVGHGGLLYGLMLGFEALRAAQVIETVPYFIAVQPENCAPLTWAYKSNTGDIPVITPLPTIAEGASVSTPVRGKVLLDMARAGAGTFFAAADAATREVYHLLAKQGIYVEPTSALSLTPLLNDKIELAQPAVTILTGTGLKTTKLAE